MNSADPGPDKRELTSVPPSPPRAAQPIPRSVDTLRGTLFVTGTGIHRPHPDDAEAMESEIVTVQASWRARPAQLLLPGYWRTLLDDEVSELIYHRAELRGYLSGAEFTEHQIGALGDYAAMLESPDATAAMRQRDPAEAIWARWLARRIRDRMERRTSTPFAIKDARQLMAVVTDLTTDANREMALPRSRGKTFANRQLAVAKRLLEASLAIEADLVE